MTVCWVKEHVLHVGTRCDGELVKAHLIPKQRIRRELKAGRSDEQLEALVWDPRVWVPVCGGPTGIGGHHGMLDYSRTVRIPREILPAGLEEFAREHGLSWSLDRDYGQRELVTPDRFREDYAGGARVRVSGQSFDPADVPARHELEGL